MHFEVFWSETVLNQLKLGTAHISKMHCVNHMALLHTVARDINLRFTQRSMILKQQVVKNFSLNLTRKDKVKC